MNLPEIASVSPPGAQKARDATSYASPDGYHVDEWECKAAGGRSETAYLLRESDEEIRWYFTRPIPISAVTLSGGKPFGEVAPTLTGPPDARVYRGLAHGLDETTDGTYAGNPGESIAKTTWDYWDAKQELNLAVERWADGRVECFHGRRTDPKTMASSAGRWQRRWPAGCARRGRPSTSQWRRCVPAASPLGVWRSVSCPSSSGSCDNLAFAVALGGYYLGILIVVGGPLASPSRGSLAWDAFLVAVWGVLAILLLNVAALVSRRVLFGGFDVNDEVLRGHLASGIVLAGSHVANALLILGALSDEGGLLPAAVFWVYAQVLLEAAAVVFLRVVRYDVQAELARDNRAVGFVLAGVRDVSRGSRRAVDSERRRRLPRSGVLRGRVAPDRLEPLAAQSRRRGIWSPAHRIS